MGAGLAPAAFTLVPSSVFQGHPPKHWVKETGDRAVIRPKMDNWRREARFYWPKRGRESCQGQRETGTRLKVIWRQDPSGRRAG